MKVFNLQDACDQLINSDLCFHFRVHPKTQYILFGDLDNYPKSIDNFISLLHTFLKDKYNLEFDMENDFKSSRHLKDSYYYYYYYLLTKKNQFIYIYIYKNKIVLFIIIFMFGFINFI
jgi:hypothetical protein